MPSADRPREPRHKADAKRAGWHLTADAPSPSRYLAETADVHHFPVIPFAASSLKALR